MRESWRDTYTYRNADLIEYLRLIRKGTFHGISMFKREIYLQAQENGLIRLPEGTREGDAHIVPFSQLTILNEAINKDEENAGN